LALGGLTHHDELAGRVDDTHMYGDFVFGGAGGVQGIADGGSGGFEVGSEAFEFILVVREGNAGQAVSASVGVAFQIYIGDSVDFVGGHNLLHGGVAVVGANEGGSPTGHARVEGATFERLDKG
jgi:hypothetical protein